jgi:hypothetical protein
MGFRKGIYEWATKRHERNFIWLMLASVIAYIITAWALSALHMTEFRASESLALGVAGFIVLEIIWIIWMHDGVIKNPEKKSIWEKAFIVLISKLIAAVYAVGFAGFWIPPVLILMRPELASAVANTLGWIGAAVLIFGGYLWLNYMIAEATKTVEKKKVR